MLVEEGFEVVSIDASDKMLKYAIKERWNRRKEPGFDNWSRFFIFIFIFFCYNLIKFHHSQYQDGHGLHTILM